MYTHTYTEGLTPILNNTHRYVSDRLIQKVSTATPPLCWELKQRLCAFEGYALPLTSISSPWFWELKGSRKMLIISSVGMNMDRRLFSGEDLYWDVDVIPDIHPVNTLRYQTMYKDKGFVLYNLQYCWKTVNNRSIPQTKTTALIRVCPYAMLRSFLKKQGRFVLCSNKEIALRHAATHLKSVSLSI